jgi:hypothetical protein
MRIVLPARTDCRLDGLSQTAVRIHLGATHPNIPSRLTLGDSPPWQGGTLAGFVALNYAIITTYFNGHSCHRREKVAQSLAEAASPVARTRLAASSPQVLSRAVSTEARTPTQASCTISSWTFAGKGHTAFDSCAQRLAKTVHQPGPERWEARRDGL